MRISWKRNLGLLAGIQALSQTGSILILAIGGLASVSLGAEPAFATLPLAFAVLGTLVTLAPSSFFMQRTSRRAGFFAGAGLGLAGSLLAAWGLSAGIFWAFCAAHLLLGAQAAFMQYLRFAASEQVPADFRSKALSLVLTGGIVASVLGPSGGLWTRDIVAPLFLGSYLGLAGLMLLQALLLMFYGESATSLASGTAAVAAPRPLSVIVAQPAFRTAVVSSVIGYGLMIMLMSATPLAMQRHDHGQDSSALVIQWHVLGMFVPSFFTGSLIKRFGPRPIVLTGALIMVLQIGCSLTGNSLLSFLSGLILLGIAWNFLFIGGSSLLTETYLPSEKGKVQATHDTSVFLVSTLMTYAAGPLEHGLGWQALNLVALPLVALVPAAWYIERRSRIRAEARAA